MRALFLIICLGFPLFAGAQNSGSDPLGTEDSFFADDPDELPEEMPLEGFTEADRDDPFAEDLLSEEDVRRAEETPITIDSEPIPLIRRDRGDVRNPYQQRPTKIYHPNAKKGLTRITKDNTYIYKTESSPQNRAASVRLGFFDPTQLQNKSGAYFSDFYDSNAPMLLVDYEWQLWQRFGKWGLKLGSGLFVANGRGQFENPDKNPGKIPKERFTFFAMPNNLSLIYRMDYFNRQFLVPFAEAGVNAFTFAEFRDDDKPPRFGGALAGHVAFGGALSLNFMDEWAILELDREYGINSVFFTAEFRLLQGFGGNFDFTGHVINAGILTEF